jgi:hypothetical protein
MSRNWTPGSDVFVDVSRVMLSKIKVGLHQTYVLDSFGGHRQGNMLYGECHVDGKMNKKKYV